MREDFTLIFKRTLDFTINLVLGNNIHKGLSRKGNLVFLKIECKYSLDKNKLWNGNCIIKNVFETESVIPNFYLEGLSIHDSNFIN